MKTTHASATSAGFNAVIGIDCQRGPAKRAVLLLNDGDKWVIDRTLETEGPIVVHRALVVIDATDFYESGPSRADATKTVMGDGCWFRAALRKNGQPMNPARVARKAEAARLIEDGRLADALTSEGYRLAFELAAWAIDNPECSDAEARTAAKAPEKSLRERLLAIASRCLVAAERGDDSEVGENLANAEKALNLADRFPPAPAKAPTP